MKNLKLNIRYVKWAGLAAIVLISLAILGGGIFTSQKKEVLSSVVADANKIDREISQVITKVNKGDDEKIFGAYQLIWLKKIEVFASESRLESLRLKIAEIQDNVGLFDYDEAISELEAIVIQYQVILDSIKELYTPVEKPAWCDNSMPGVIKQTTGLLAKMDFNLTSIEEDADHSFIITGFAPDPRNMNRIDDFVRLLDEGVGLLSRPEVIALGSKAAEGESRSGFTPRSNFSMRVFLNPLTYGGDCEKENLVLGLKKKQLDKLVRVPISTHVFRGSQLEDVKYLGAVNQIGDRALKAMLTVDGVTYSAREKSYIGPRVYLERITPSSVFVQVKESLLGEDSSRLEIPVKR